MKIGSKCAMVNMMDAGNPNHVEAREPCPKCRESGRDKHGDNMAVYGDGHKYCFACGYRVASDKWRLLEQAVKVADSTPKEDVNGLPADYCILKDALWAKGAIAWLKRYGITENEMLEHRIGWSMSRNLLIFPVYNENNQCILWQGRNFGDSEGPKYLTFGKKYGIMDLCGNSHSDTVIVTEDKVSAIKVGRHFQSFPLFGSTMDLELIKKAAARFSCMGIWLDRDKTVQAVKIALKASQYIPTFVVDSLMDPKAYSSETILTLVGTSAGETFYKERQGKVEDFLPSKVEETKEVFPAPKKPIAAVVEKYIDPNADIRDLMNTVPELQHTAAMHSKDVQAPDPHETTRINVREDEALYGRERFVSDWEGDPTEYRKHSHGS